ncbi:MAG TPA: hypothetical protein VM755_00950 [Stellaceae bacterium]|nr:hypothetical protein [Stellaceae bacterium]
MPAGAPVSNEAGDLLRQARGIHRRPPALAQPGEIDATAKPTPFSSKFFRSVINRIRKAALD